MKNNISYFNQKEIEEFIIGYLDEKADKIVKKYPFYFVRLNEMKSELKRIFQETTR